MPGTRISGRFAPRLRVASDVRSARAICELTETVNFKNSNSSLWQLEEYLRLPREQTLSSRRRGRRSMLFVRCSRVIENAPRAPMVNINRYSGPYYDIYMHLQYLPSCGAHCVLDRIHAIG